jgi:hypothetical protein
MTLGDGWDWDTRLVWMGRDIGGWDENSLGRVEPWDGTESGKTRMRRVERDKHDTRLGYDFGQVKLETSIVLISITTLVGKQDETSVVLVSTSNTVGLATLLSLTDGSTPWFLSTQQVQPAPVVFADRVDPCLARVRCQRV